MRWMPVLVSKVYVTVFLRDRDTEEAAGQNIYFHLNHPIRWVRLVGLVVAFEVYPNRITMTLDDTSGLTIEIFCKKETTGLSMINTMVDHYGTVTLKNARKSSDGERVCTTSEGKVSLQEIDVGSVVKIKGGLSEFRGEKQATLERISLVHTTNEEVEAWAQNTAFYQHTLSRPWTISERERQQAKLKATGKERKRRARTDRKEKMLLREEKHKYQRNVEQQTRVHRQQARKEKQARCAGGATHGVNKQETGESESRSRQVTAKRFSRPVVPGTFNALGL
ncbi:MAG: hypothetical protein Q9222_001913 [Ikaeria aurantiellina]